MFTGVAGGLQAGVEVGDLVLGSSYVQHDMDASPIFPRYVLPSKGIALLDADIALIASLLIAAKSIYTTTNGEFEGKNTIRNSIHQGLIASGDRFVSSLAEVHALRAALPDALCVEMEGAAVAQVCHDYALPFAAVRTISDRADDSAHLDFSQFVRDVAGPAAVRLMDVWLQNRLNLTG